MKAASRFLAALCVVAFCFLFAPPAPAHTPSFQTSFVDDGGDGPGGVVVGFFNSLAFSPTSGKPSISYYDHTNGNLKYAERTGSSWHCVGLDGAFADVGLCTSLAFDTSGCPAISYYDSTNGNLKITMGSDVGWSLGALDTAGDVGMNTSLALAPTSGLYAIAYFDWTHQNLKYATDSATGWKYSTVDSTTGSGFYGTSLKFNPSTGRPSIAYPQFSTGSGDVLKYAEWTGSSWNTSTVDAAADVGLSPSLAYNASGNPAIVYLDNTNLDLKYAEWNGSAWDITTVDDSGLIPSSRPSLAFSADGFPAISYQYLTQLNYAHKDSQHGWQIQAVDTSPNVGDHTSLAFDPRGNPAISYFEYDLVTGGRLKYAFVPIPGDADMDYDVDQVDAAIVAAHWGQSGGWSDGDFTGDGVVSAADASILAANWDYGTSEAGAVPEPGTIIMLVLGVSMLAVQRSR
jgi:hypothetical protein